MAANDNFYYATTNCPHVILKNYIENIMLEGSELLSEIRIILDILGKPWQCDALVEGIYRTLYPYQVTVSELTILLMSIHVEYTHYLCPKKIRKRAIMRYVVEHS